MMNYKVNQRWRFRLDDGQVLTGTIISFSSSMITLKTIYREVVRFRESKVEFGTLLKDVEASE